MTERDTSTGQEPPAGRRRTLQLTAAGLSSVAVCYGLARFAFGLFVPSFRAEFSLGPGAVGAIAAGSYVSYCLAIVAATLLTPRLGGRAVAVAAGALATAGVLVVAAAPSAGVLAVGIIVAGSSTGVASPPLAHAVAHAVPPQVRDRTQTVVNAGTGLGVAVAGPVALLTGEHWRTSWVVFAIMCALVTLWTFVAVPSGPSGRSGPGAAQAALPRPALPAGAGPLIAAAAALGTASCAVWTFGRDLLVSTGGMSGPDSSVAWILLGIFGALGAAGGDLARRWGLGAAWTATMLVLAASTTLLAACPGVPAVAWAASAAFGAAYIASTGLLLIWGTDVYPHGPVAGVGLAFLVIALGQSLSAPALGALSQVAGAPAAFVTAGSLAVLGSVVRPRRPAHPGRRARRKNPAP